MKLVTAEAVMTALCQHCDSHIEMCEECGMREIIESVPSAWISVKDRLPEKVGSYLVYAPTYIGGSSSAKECKAGVMFARWLKGGHWSIEVGYYQRPGCVTHWMPLPDAPEVDE